MDWWVVMLLPLPIMAVLAIGTLVGIAVDVSAEGEWRRVHSNPASGPCDLADDDADDVELEPATAARHSPLGA
jgi:hypothetical protein